jgi:hypothetical protein
MSDSVRDQLSTDLEKAKAEGGMRATRIREIIKAAATETIAEVKAGSRELGAIAKDSFTTATANLNTAAENPASDAVASSPAANSEVTTDAQPFSAQFEQQSEQQSEQQEPQSVRFKTLISSFFTILRAGAGNLDSWLSGKYGDRYSAAKRQLEQGATWYTTTLEQAQSTPLEPTALEKKQNELAARAEAAGAVVARREQQIKQQIKTIVQTAVSKQ